MVRNHPKKLLDMFQEAYIKRVLECFRMHYSKAIDTQVEKGLTMSLYQYATTNDEKEKISNVPYTTVVGSLMYVVLSTKFKIYFTVGLLSHYQSN